MQEIKLTQKQKIDNAIAALVDAINGTEESIQPKKERWFKCLKPENYKHSLKQMKPYRFDFIPTDATASIQYMADAFPNDWQEIQPDFICKYSGEGFMKGDKCVFIYSYRKDNCNDFGIIEDYEINHRSNLAYFHTREDALAWQEAKFGKKVEEKKPEKIFKVAQVRELLNQLHNEEITFSRMVEIMNEIANKGGK